MTERRDDDEAAWAPRHHGIHSGHVHGGGTPGPVRVSSHSAGDAAAGTAWGPELERVHYADFFGGERLSHGHGPVYEGPSGSWSTPGALPGGYRPSTRPPLDDETQRQLGETPSGDRDWEDEATAAESGGDGGRDASATRDGAGEG